MRLVAGQKPGFHSHLSQFIHLASQPVSMAHDPPWVVPSSLEGISSAGVYVLCVTALLHYIIQPLAWSLWAATRSQERQIKAG